MLPDVVSFINCMVSLLWRAYEVGVFGAAAALLLLEVWLSGFDVVLVGYTASDLFVRRLISMFGLIMIILLFRAAYATVVVA